jgi:hypothetical protein
MRVRCSTHGEVEAITDEEGVHHCSACWADVRRSTSGAGLITYDVEAVRPRRPPVDEHPSGEMLMRVYREDG